MSHIDVKEVKMLAVRDWRTWFKAQGDLFKPLTQYKNRGLTQHQIKFRRNKQTDDG